MSGSEYWIKVLCSVSYDPDHGPQVTQHLSGSRSTEPEGALSILACFCFPSVPNVSELGNVWLSSPGPRHHTFVLTNDHGERTYCACVTWCASTSALQLTMSHRWEPRSAGFTPRALCATSLLRDPEALLQSVVALQPATQHSESPELIGHLLSIPYPLPAAPGVEFRLAGQSITVQHPSSPLAPRAALEVLLQSVDASRLSMVLAAMLLDKSIVLWSSQIQQLFLVVSTSRHNYACGALSWPSVRVKRCWV